MHTATWARGLVFLEASRPLLKSGKATFNYSCNPTPIGHGQREIAVTLLRNVGHDGAKYAGGGVIVKEALLLLRAYC